MNRVGITEFDTKFVIVGTLNRPFVDFFPWFPINVKKMPFVQSMQYAVFGYHGFTNKFQPDI